MTEPTEKVALEIVSGVEGMAIYLNNYRIAGPKPWGGGQVVKSLHTTRERLRSAVPSWFEEAGNE